MDDGVSGEHADLDGSRCDGYASRLNGLCAQVQTVLERWPLSGHVFVFRGRREDIVKVLWFDGDGLCLLAKRLERGRFVWPQATSGTASLTLAQLSMLLEGIDWRASARTAERVMSVYVFPLYPWSFSAFKWSACMPCFAHVRRP